MPKTQEQKRQEAEERRAAYEGRTAAQQLDLVDRRRGGSTAERAKLMKRLNEESTQPAKMPR